MTRLILLAALLLACSAALSGCGVVAAQANRAVNLLRVPVRVTFAPALPCPGPVSLHAASLPHAAAPA